MIYVKMTKNLQIQLFSFIYFYSNGIGPSFINKAVFLKSAT